jgi:hypothetical protein
MEENKKILERFERMEKMIQELLAAKLQQIPEVIQDLIPEGLTPEETLEWLDTQERKGLFRTVPIMFRAGEPKGSAAFTGLGTAPFTGPGTAPGTGPGTEIMGVNSQEPEIHDLPAIQDQEEANEEYLQDQLPEDEVKGLFEQLNNLLPDGITKAQLRQQKNHF